MRDDAEIFLSVTETAERLGVTPRALRLYESKGLVAPRRTDAGWRLYGQAEFERLHQVIALKAMGFPLGLIRTMLDDGRIDLASVLAAQEDDLTAKAENATRALALVRAARERLDAVGALSRDDLIGLTRQLAAGEAKADTVMGRLIERHFSLAQRERLCAWMLNEEEQAKSAQRWDRLIARAMALADGDPGAPEALALARDVRAEVSRFTRDDPGLMAAARAVYDDGFSTPETARAMPFSKEIWEFLGAARAKLLELEDEGPVV